VLVVDASAVTELLLGRPSADHVAEVIAGHGYDLHAPHLLDVEVVSAIRRVVSRDDASAARGTEAIEDLLDLPIERYPHHLLVPRIWSLRDNLSAYDAAYVALAEVVTDGGAPLLTADARLAGAAEAHAHAEIVLVSSA
jgi:predicted nucleic acid-binding protein